MLVLWSGLTTLKISALFLEKCVNWLEKDVSDGDSGSSVDD